MKYFVFPILMLLTLSSYSQKKAEFQSTRVQTDITINGNGDEWPMPLQYTDNKISYGVSNNDKYVFILVQSLDRTIQQKIMRSGITLNLSTKGKEKKKLTISYPLKSTSANTPREQGVRPSAELQQARQSLEGRNLRLSNSTTEMRVKGFSTIKGKVPAKNENGLNASITWEAENLITYELAIPIEEIIGEITLQEAEDLAIEMKIQINAISKPTQSGAGGSAGAGGGGGRGGRGGGGGGGGRSGGGMSPGGAGAGGAQSEMFINKVFKASFTLKDSE